MTKILEIVHGKEPTENIVSIEYNRDTLQIFIEKNGEISTLSYPYEAWVLAPQPLEPKGWLELDGNLHYKYAKLYDDYFEFRKEKKLYELGKEDVWAPNDPKEQAMLKDGFTYFKGMNHKQVSILSFDIETTSIKHTPDSKVLIISNTYRSFDGKITRKMFCYDQYRNQKDMLEKWCDWVREIDPSIIVGHNIFMFDLPYLQHVANMSRTFLKLGRNNTSVKFEQFQRKFRKDGSQFYNYNRATIFGREVIDTLFLAFKYDVGRKYKSYSLKNIIAEEGLQVEGRQFYDASKINANYQIQEEWQKIKDYAEHDADDALALYDLMSPVFFYMAQSIPRSYQSIIESATGSQINGLMVRSYLQEGHSIPKASPPAQFEGGISFGHSGIYSHCVKWDASSLYPSIMINYEIFDKAKDPNQNMLQILQYFTSERLKNKKKAKETKDGYFSGLEQSQKILINSFFGFMGATGLSFNYPNGAAEVTRNGREILNKSISWAESKKFIITSGDTDSIMVCKEDQSPFSDQEKKDLLVELNSIFPEKIRWEDDGYYPRVVIAKAKNYLLYDGKKIKTKGSALKATQKEPALAEFIQEILKAMIDGHTNYVDIYHKYVKEIFDIKDMNRWAYKKTITEKILNPHRSNEQKVKDAIENKSVFEGDKIHAYFKEDGTIKLIEDFAGDYDPKRLLDKLYKTALVFDNIIDVKSLFLNYKLKRNQAKLAEVLVL